MKMDAYMSTTIPEWRMQGADFPKIWQKTAYILPTKAMQ